MTGLRLEFGLAATLVGVLLAVGCQALPSDVTAKDEVPRSPGAFAVDNPGVFQLDDPSTYDQVLAISDTHGMYDATLRLLAAGGLITASQDWSAGRTLLVVVGDSIDKGSQSLELINLWIKLQRQAQNAGGMVVHTLGNHEAEFLANPDNPKAQALRDELARQSLPVLTLTDPEQPMGAFLYRQPLAARVGRWLFVHAGLYPDSSWSEFKTHAWSTLHQGAYGDAFLAGEQSVLEAKDWWKLRTTRQELESRLAANGMWGMVQGHQPDAYYLHAKIGVIDGGQLIKIDNGMAPEAGANPGQLLRFPHPSELVVEGFPTAQCLSAAGTAIDLKPVDFDTVPEVHSASD